MEILKDWLKERFSDFKFTGEAENIFTFSLGWKNLRTAFFTNEENENIRIDFRLAFRDVTFECLVDFIDYRFLFKEGEESIDNYQIIYLGRFDKEIQDNQVYSSFIIDRRIRNVSHSYYTFDKDPAFTEIFRLNYPVDVSELRQISIKEPGIKEPTDNKFGLRVAGVDKCDLPNQPLISIILPSFNSESVIEQALQSAISQTYENKEIIIVDGGSKDGTPTVVKKYEDKIDWFNSEPDKNIFDAINKGTYISKGMYSIFIGSDDLLMPDALQNFVNDYVKKGACDYAYGNFINLHPSGRLTFLKTFIKSKYYGKFMIAHPAMFISRRTFEELSGFNIEHYICADADFELKLITANKKGRKLDDFICIFRGGGHSSFKMQNVQQVYRIFKNYNALNSGYYFFAFKMQLINIFIKVFGKKVLARVVSILKREG